MTKRRYYQAWLLLPVIIYDRLKLKTGNMCKNHGEWGIYPMDGSGKAGGEAENGILPLLDRGMDDMEAGRELPLEEAFQKIGELRKIRRNTLPNC